MQCYIFWVDCGKEHDPSVNVRVSRYHVRACCLVFIEHLACQHHGGHEHKVGSRGGNGECPVRGC